MAKIIKNGIEYNHSTTNFEIGETPPLDPSVELWFDTSEEMPMADYIVERGTTNGWTWEKWASGKATCWGIFTISSFTDIVPSSTGISDLYIRYARIALPFEFIGNYVATGSINWYTTEWIGAHRKNSTEIEVRIFGASSILNRESYNLSFNVVGTWK